MAILHEFEFPRIYVTTCVVSEATPIGHLNTASIEP